MDFTSYHKLQNMGDARSYLNNIVKVKVETLKYSTKYEEAAETELNFLQAKVIKQFPTPSKLNSLRGFNKQTEKELIEKWCPLMPENRRIFLKNLPESNEPDSLQHYS